MKQQVRLSASRRCSNAGACSPQRQCDENDNDGNATQKAALLTKVRAQEKLNIPSCYAHEHIPIGRPLESGTISFQRATVDVHFLSYHEGRVEPDSKLPYDVPVHGLAALHLVEKCLQNVMDFVHHIQRPLCLVQGHKKKYPTVIICFAFFRWSFNKLKIWQCRQL